MSSNSPTISVIMSCHNRADYISESIDSILNQTYKDFEFIILDNASTDGTSDIVRKYAENDNRIVYIRNEEDQGLINNLNTGLSMARGKYIARMDDDDISLPTRFEKQVEYMDSHEDVVVCGTFIKTFGENITTDSWIDECEPDNIAILMNFYNPMCHPTVIMRNSFFKSNDIKYSVKAVYAEEYDLWKQVLLKDGKIANIPEILLNYRIHNSRMSVEKQIEQNNTAASIKRELLSRFFNNTEITDVINSVLVYPFTPNNKNNLYKIINHMCNNDNERWLPNSSYKKFISKYCGIPCNMDIFFASSNEFSKYLCVAMTSILTNSLPFEQFTFYILDSGISKENKRKINRLKRIKDFNIEYLNVNKKIFKDIPLCTDCAHVPIQTYYRFIIPKIKPELKKCFYFDCDIIVKNSLQDLWNIDLGDNYAGVVEELFSESPKDASRYGLKHSFNAGILLINNKLWVKENIMPKLFENTVYLEKNNLLRWDDQDVLNYTFGKRVLYVSPKYNLQQNAFFNGQHSCCTDKDFEESKRYPVIIHYNGHVKPWEQGCRHALANEYFKYMEIAEQITNRKTLFEQFIQNVFSVKNEDIHKIVTILGIKFKFKIKKLIKRQGADKNSCLEDIFSVKIPMDRKHKIITILGIKMKFKRRPNIKDIIYELENVKSLQVARKDEVIWYQQKLINECMEKLQAVDCNINEQNKELIKIDKKFDNKIQRYNESIENMSKQLKNQLAQEANIISDKFDTFVEINQQLSSMSNELDELKIKLSKTDDILKFQQTILDNVKWYGHPVSCINNGVNTIFQYMTGLQLTKNFQPERVVAFDLDNAPIDHYQRYKFVEQFINENDDVLDIACGTGYGSSAISKIAHSVKGIDVSQAAVNFANKVFANDNLTYECKNGTELDFENVFDKIISFESIEHIIQDELFIQNLYKALKTGGTLICSVPNQNVFPYDSNIVPFHIKHYTPNMITELLTKNGFIVEDIYYQYLDENHQIMKKENEGYTILCIAKKN